MVKLKDKPESEIRTPGPKSKRSIIPADFQIRRHDNPMRMILDESEGRSLPIKTRPVSESRLVNQSSQPVETSLDLESRLVSESDQHKTSVDLMASLPDVKGFLKFYFQLID